MYPIPANLQCHKSQLLSYQLPITGTSEQYTLTSIFPFEPPIASKKGLSSEKEMEKTAPYRHPELSVIIQLKLTCKTCSMSNMFNIFYCIFCIRFNQKKKKESHTALGFLDATHDG